MSAQQPKRVCPDVHISAQEWHLYTPMGRSVLDHRSMFANKHIFPRRKPRLGMRLLWLGNKHLFFKKRFDSGKIMVLKWLETDIPEGEPSRSINMGPHSKETRCCWIRKEAEMTDDPRNPKSSSFHPISYLKVPTYSPELH